jgi:hypothetical protein
VLGGGRLLTGHFSFLMSLTARQHSSRSRDDARRSGGSKCRQRAAGDGSYSAALLATMGQHSLSERREGRAAA